jgi:FMN-dependent NADH-azoreductase
MPTLLDIQASSRTTTSVSRTLSASFVAQWAARHPDGTVLTRDLAVDAPPLVDAAWINGAFILPEQRTPAMNAALAVSDGLVAELKTADRILIGTPMFNYGLPAVLKAYIDQIVRLFDTFTPQRKGLLTDTSLTVILASGRFYTPGAQEEDCNEAARYLRRIFGYIGIDDIDIVLAGGTTGIVRGEVSFDDHIARFLPDVAAAVR